MSLKSRLEKLEKRTNRIDRATIIRGARLKAIQKSDKQRQAQLATLKNRDNT